MTQQSIGNAIPFNSISESDQNTFVDGHLIPEDKELKLEKIESIIELLDRTWRGSNSLERVYKS